MDWTQTYDPLGSAWLSTIVAALPIVVLFIMLGLLRRQAWQAAVAALATALVVAIAA